MRKYQIYRVATRGYALNDCYYGEIDIINAAGVKSITESLVKDGYIEKNDKVIISGFSDSCNYFKLYNLTELEELKFMQI